MLILKQSTASQAVLIGPFVDSTDGSTAETGLTIANTDIRLSANGANMFAKTSGGGTHDEAGWYTITLDATDTATVGSLQLSVDVSGALPVFTEFQVLEENVYDAWFAAGAAAGTDLASILTDTGTTLDGKINTIDSNVDSVLADTADMQPKLGTPAADVSADIAAVKVDTAATLTDTADMQPKIGTPAADVSADIAAVKVDTAAILVDTGTTLDGKLDTIDNVVDAIKVVTDQLVAANAEPTGVPAVNETLLVKLAYLFMALRNKVTVTATKKIFFDDGGASEWEKDLSDDGTTYTETEGNAP